MSDGGRFELRARLRQLRLGLRQLISLGTLLHVIVLRPRAGKLRLCCRQLVWLGTGYRLAKGQLLNEPRFFGLRHGQLKLNCVEFSQHLASFDRLPFFHIDPGHYARRLKVQPHLRLRLNAPRSPDGGYQRSPLHRGHSPALALSRLSSLLPAAIHPSSGDQRHNDDSGDYDDTSLHILYSIFRSSSLSERNSFVVRASRSSAHYERTHPLSDRLLEIR